MPTKIKQPGSAKADGVKNFEMQDLEALEKNRAVLKAQLLAEKAQLPAQESSSLLFGKFLFDVDLTTKKSAIDKMLLSIPASRHEFAPDPGFENKEIGYLHSIKCVEDARKVDALPKSFLAAEQRSIDMMLEAL